jgi:N-methylhydantoinase A
VPKYEPRAEPPQPARPAGAAKGKRRIYFDATRSVEATLYERDQLDVGMTVTGPAIVEQFDATTVIPSGWTGRVDGYRNLILERA